MTINIKSLCEQPHVFRLFVSHLRCIGFRNGWSREQIERALDVTIDGWVAAYKKLKTEEE